MSEVTLIRLERALRERAEAVDAIVNEPLQTPSRKGYRRWLCNLYNFVSAFETSFAFAPNVELVFIEPRIKSGRIASDLLALGLTGAEHQRLAQRVDVPPFSSSLECYGWCFVVERMALQLAGLREQLQPSLPHELAIAGSFLDVYGGEVTTRWNELGDAIDRSLHDDADMRTLAFSARMAFGCLATCSAPPEASTVQVELHATAG